MATTGVCGEGQTAVSFTGGKDCVLAMHLIGAGKMLPALAAAAEHQQRLSWTAADTEAALATVSLLVTFAPPDADFKAHPLPIIRLQAKAIRLQHIVLEIDPKNAAESYKQRIKQLHREHGISRLVTGDILDIAGGFMQKAALGTGVELVTPLWQQPRGLILQSLLDLGVQAVISCVCTAKYRAKSSCNFLEHSQTRSTLAKRDSASPSSDNSHPAPTSAALASAAQENDSVAAAVDQSLDSLQTGQDSCSRFDATTLLLGQTISPELVQGPLGMAERLFGCDVCGEYGEYHTLVTAAPMFYESLHLRVSTVMACPTSAHSYIVWDVV